VGAERGPDPGGRQPDPDGAGAQRELERLLVGERDVATVNGKVIGIPALVDNLAVVYNKTLFQQAGLAPPGPGWTWDQFTADAKRLTDVAKKQYGTAT